MIFKPYSNLLIDWLSSLKRRSIVNRIGVSLYNEKMINKLPLDKLDIIQIPLSLYDQGF